MFHLSIPHKKISVFLGLFISLAMIFSLYIRGFYVLAQEVETTPENTAFTFAISSAIVVPGETIDITISMQNNPGLSGLDFDFSFENLGSTANVKPVSITPLDDFTMGIFSSNLDELNSDANIDWQEQNIITAAWSDANNILTADGDLFSIRFDISDSAKSGVYALDLAGTVVNEVYEELAFEKSTGSIEVLELEVDEPIDFLYGDTYYDEAVEIRDATRLSQFLVSQIALSQYETLAANVNYDLIDNEELIDIKDAIKLSQWLADYEDIRLGDGPDGTGTGRKPTK